MSKEEEARQQRGSNYEPPSGYSNQGYGGSPPHVQTAAYPEHNYNYNTQQQQYQQQQYQHYPAVSNPVVGPTIFATGRYVEAKKSVVEAYLLWFLLGLVGAHHFYLKRPVFGVVYFFTFGLLGCGYLIDMFRMPYLVQKANKQLDDPKEMNKKNISDAYTLWFPFGLLGFHHFYLNSPGFGVLYFCTFGLFGIGWLIDLVRIPYLVKQINENPTEPPLKSTCTACVFAISPAGILGTHHFYLNRPLFGMMYFLTFGNFGIGWMVDWFRVSTLVKRANKEIRQGPDNKRYLDEAYLTWLPLGLIGMHHFYLNRPVWGVIYFLTFGLFGFGWLIDGCRLPCLVDECNKLNEERRRIPTTFTVMPTGYGYPVVSPGVVAASYTGYSAHIHYGAAGAPAGSHPQPVQYQYPPQQNIPSYVEQPPPYSPPKPSTLSPPQPPVGGQATK